MNEYSSENAEFIEIGDLWDGCHLDVEYPAEMSEQEIERLTDLWEEESYSAWKKAGWRNANGYLARWQKNLEGKVRELNLT